MKTTVLTHAEDSSSTSCSLDPAAPVTYVSGQNDFEDTEWSADGAFIYAGTCTGVGAFIYGGTCTGVGGGVYRMDPWAPRRGVSESSGRAADADEGQSLRA
jgi:hypothetical protein